MLGSPDFRNSIRHGGLPDDLSVLAIKGDDDEETYASFEAIVMLARTMANGRILFLAMGNGRGEVNPITRHERRGIP